MVTLKDWLETKYLEWQHGHGLMSLRKWSEALGISYSHLMSMISGDRPGTTMQTAYQIGERLGDFSILEVLGYPVPDAPLTGFSPEQREYILGFLSRVKTALVGLTPAQVRWIIGNVSKYPQSCNKIEFKPFLRV